MKIWIDDVRSAPTGYFWLKSVNEVKQFIKDTEEYNKIPHMFNVIHEITLIDIDHDAGSFVKDGGDYIKILDWFEETGRNYPIHIHSKNPVGIDNMRRIIQRNNWKEV